MDSNRTESRARTTRQDDLAHMLRAVATLGRFTVAEAIHSKVAIAAVFVVVCGEALARFGAELALTDSSVIRTLSLAWAFRVAAVFLLASFAVSSVVRDHEDKGIELLLSLPLPRAGYLLGKWAGCVVAALALAFVFALPLALAAPVSGVATWGLSLALELILVASASLLCALTFNHVVGSLAAVAAFYVLARTIGALLAIGSSAVAPIGSAAFDFANRTLQAIAALLPRLDLFTRSEWLSGHGAVGQDLAVVVLQALAGTFLLLAAALIDLMRKSV